jgi:archaellum component FlaC
MDTNLQVQVGAMAERVEHVVRSVDTMSRTLGEVRDTQLHQGRDIRELRAKIEEIEPIVSNLETMRHTAKGYSNGVLFGVSMASGAVGAALHNVKAIAAMIASLLTP